MSFGKGNNTTTQTTGPSAGAFAAYNSLLDRAGNVSNTPYAFGRGIIKLCLGTTRKLNIKSRPRPIRCGIWSG